MHYEYHDTKGSYFRIYFYLPTFQLLQSPTSTIDFLANKQTAQQQGDTIHLHVMSDPERNS